MHTVIITDKHTTPLFDSDKYMNMFAPFFVERGGSICQCSWNENGQEIEQAVPELYKSIKGYPEWRAIIFIHPTQIESQPFNPKNPFDFDCNRNDDITIGRNPVSLVQLTHMLSGFPPLGVKNYKMGYVYYNSQEDEFKSCLNEDKGFILQKNVNKLNADERKSLFEKFEKLGGTPKPKLIEENYSPNEKNEHKKLIQKYSFKENRPVEVLIVSTREIFEPDDRETTREEVRRAWEFRDEEESSDFWKIYPNTCRFLCYDLLNPEHTLYPRELWRLCLLILTLAVNEIPGQSLQAYQLYKADLAINTDELGYTFDNHIDNLFAVQAIIQERMLCSSDLTQDKKKELVPTQDISVKFEQVSEGDVQANPQKLGLASNCPISEKRFWREHIKSTKQTIDNILSAPQEITVDKALQTRRQTYTFLDKEQVLDRFQIEKVNKRLDELEAQVINSNVYGMLDSDVHKEKVAEAGEEVRKFMGLRLTKRNIFLISFFSLFIYLCGFIPYFINSAKISGEAIGAAVGLAVIALIILAGGGLLVLWFLRRRLVKKIKSYNKKVIAIFDRVNKSAYVYSDYFSSVCTYMYAKSLLSGVTLKHDSDFTAARIQKAHLSSIKKEIERYKNLCFLYKVSLKDDSSLIDTNIDLTENFLSKMPADSQIYEFSPNKEKSTMELNKTGEKLNAPYSFVKGVSLVREELYTKKGA